MLFIFLYLLMIRFYQMNSTKKTVILGLLGVRLDSGARSKRWEKWRPTVSLTQQEDLLVDRLELIYQPNYSRLVRLVREDIAQVSPETVVRTHSMEIVNPWNLEEVYGSLHDFCVNYPFDTEKEDYLVHITTGTHIEQICLFLLVESRLLPARLVQSSPGRTPATRAPGRLDTIDLDLDRYDQLATRFARKQAENLSSLKAGIETKNESFNTLISQMERVATASNDPLLLLGPTGAGKSRLARLTYELKKNNGRVQGAFVDVNCATLRGDAAMSALFGHVKGAFTGASGPRAGLLQAADQGVLFLDEIAELGSDEQAMILRALEEKRYYPVGADQPVGSDFQLIAGTNCDLYQAVQKGTFREDLLARIDIWTFRLPSLKERPEDIAPNLEYELIQVARERDEFVRFSTHAKKRYLDFAQGPQAAWSGNFRDLSASVRRMATLSKDGRIRTQDVEDEISRLRSRWQAGAPATTPQLSEPLKTAFPRAYEALAPEDHSQDQFDLVQLEAVLEVLQASRSMSEAGRKLFAHSRSLRATRNDSDRLRKYLARFRLDGKDWLA